MSNIDTFDCDECFNLTIVRKSGVPPSILLGRKATGFGQGLLTMPGGKEQHFNGEIYLLETEPPAEGAVREVNQETGLAITLADICFRGVISAYSDETDAKSIKLFEATVPPDAFAIPSREFEWLDWFPENDLPYDQMPPDYELWLPHVLGGTSVMAMIEAADMMITRASVYGIGPATGGRLSQLHPALV